MSSRKRWTLPEDGAVTSLFIEGTATPMGVRVLAKQLNRSYRKVCERAAKLKCPGVCRKLPTSPNGLARDTGYSRCRIFAAMARLGIEGKHLGGARKDGAPKGRRLSQAEAKAVIEECMSIPDGSLLRRIRAGDWRGRPTPHCTDCKSQEKPPYAKGRCRHCYDTYRSHTRKASRDPQHP